MRGCRSPASTRAATAAIRRSGRDTRVPIEVGGEQRAGEREEPGEDERARDAALGVRDGRQRLADADRHALVRRAGVHGALEQAQVADVGESERRVAPAARSAGAPDRRFSSSCSAGGLALVRRARCRTARDGWCCRRPPGTTANSSVELALNGWSAHVARGGLRRPARGERVVDAIARLCGELGGIARDLPVDLVAQLGPGAAVDGDEAMPVHSSVTSVTQPARRQRSPSERERLPEPRASVSSTLPRR